VDLDLFLQHPFIIFMEVARVVAVVVANN